MRVAIIPARGGSKRIARKNIRPFAGQPVIAWSIAAALETGLFDAIIVSTDDDEIADVAVQHGARAPFRRPPELSDDHTGTMPVLAHAIDWINSHESAVSQVCCLYATAPFVNAQSLQRGYDRLMAGDCTYAFSVTSYAFAIQRALSLNENGKVNMFWPDNQQTRSQDLPQAYHDAGQFYWGQAQSFLEQQPVFTTDAAAVVIARHLVQDIDTEEDWRRAELMFKALQAE